jgi:hypothetical protein
MQQTIADRFRLLCFSSPERFHEFTGILCLRDYSVVCEGGLVSFADSRACKAAKHSRLNTYQLAQKDGRLLTVLLVDLRSFFC